MTDPCDLCLIVDHAAFRCGCPCHDDRSRGEHSRTSPDGSVTVTVPCDELAGELGAEAVSWENVASRLFCQCGRQLNSYERSGATVRVQCQCGRKASITVGPTDERQWRNPSVGEGDLARAMRGRQ